MPVSSRLLPLEVRGSPLPPLRIREGYRAGIGRRTHRLSEIISLDSGGLCTDHSAAANLCSSSAIQWCSIALLGDLQSSN